MFNISAEDIAMAFQEIDYDLISVKQMIAKHPTSEGGVTPLPTFASKKSKSSKNLQFDYSV
jgi:hypothetical protein